MNKGDTLIFITGGHITPALALMDEIRSRHSTWRIVCVGRITAFEGVKEESVERTLVTKKGAVFLPLTAGRFSRTPGISAIGSFFKIPVGFVQALWYCIAYKPNVVMSFGGYIALPVALAAYILRIPIITHEQTRVVGLANRIIGRIARKICVTFEDQVSSFAPTKTVVTGLPMRRELFDPPSKSPFAIPGKLPVIYVTGGSTGAVTLNDRIFPAIEQLTKAYIVIHQIGKLSWGKAQEIRAKLPSAQKSRYIIQDFFDTHEVAWILRRTALIVGRSGANTVMEAAALGKKMICIPLPWSGGGEQMANAQWLVARNLGIILPQHEVSPERIRKEIEGALKTSGTKKIDTFTDGAKRLLAQIDAILGG